MTARRLVPLAALVLTLLWPSAGHAAFPGANGKIAFVRDGLAGGIHTMDPDGSDPVNLTPLTPGDASPAWSPDGDEIAFTSARNGNFDIYVMNADGSEQTRVTTHAATDADPTWSPDGEQIAFISTRDGSVEIYVLDVDSPEDPPPARLTNNSVADNDPNWSPDGDRIAFVSFAGTAQGTTQPNPEIFAMDSDGGNRNQLTDNDGDGPGTNTHGDIDPSFSPSGERIAFMSTRRQFPTEDAYPRLWTMTAGGGNVGLLTDSENDHANPAWAPDGQRIAYERNTLDSPGQLDAEIFVATSSGTGADNLTSNDVFDGEPDWQPLPHAVAIGSGPSGLTNQASATLEFVYVGAVAAPPGRFECRLGGSGDFTPCTSPVTVGPLADGEQVFEVRYHPDGEEPGPATERRWTVDTTPPEVLFDNAPSGADNPPEAELAFHSTEPEGATFRCAVDGGALFECASPHALFDLAPGPHVFEVQTSDRAGNDSAPVRAEWEVGAGGVPQTVACVAPTSSEAGFGVIRLVAREEGACFADEIVNGQAAKVARGKVALNGIDLMPAPGTRIIVTVGAGDGSVRADGPLRIAFGGVFEELDDLDLSGLSTTANRLNKEIAFAEGLLSVAGMESVPAVQVEFSADNGGQTKVTFRLTLPRAAFSRLPGGSTAEGVTVEFAPTVSNDKGVTFAGRIKLASVYVLRKVKIKDLDLAYDHATGVFDGSFGMALGDAIAGRAEPTITGSMGIAPTSSPCFISRYGLVASNLNKHIGRGVFLQRLGGNFACAMEGARVVSKLSATGGVSLGPRIAIGSFEAEALSLDGTGTLTIPVGPAPPLFTFEVTGAAKLVEIPLLSHTVKFTPPAQVEWSGLFDATIGGHGVQLAQRNTWISEQGFNYEGAGRVRFFGLDQAAEGVISTTGFAICMGPPGDQVGFGKRWGNELTTLATCDVGQFRSAVPARPAQNGERSFEVPSGGRVRVVELKGSGAPPEVVVGGPGGERIGPSPVSTREHMLVQDDDTDTTFVTFFSPAAGRWTVTPEDGSAPISRLRVAEGLPPVKLSARVSGAGARRTLTWKAGGLGGQRIQFVERGRGDGANVLATVRRSRGRLRFTPDPGLGTSRRVEAIVLNRGMPRSTDTVARYRVAPEPRPRKVKGLRLRGSTLSWKAQRGMRYELAVTRPDGRQTSHATRRTRIRLRALPRRARIRVEIVALDELDRPGPPARSRLTAGRR